MNTYERAWKAILDLFDDKTTEAKEGLIALRDHIDVLIEALEADNK
jgi:hypothetical protein